MKLYVAINKELNDGQDPETFVLGVYSNMENAINVLERQAKDDLQMFEEEDAENFERTDFCDGHFTITDGYYTYEYIIEEKELDN